MGMYLEKEKVALNARKFSHRTSRIVREESQASSMHRSYAISYADRDMAEEVKVESRADKERS
jgi:hypothetical protein